MTDLFLGGSNAINNQVYIYIYICCICIVYISYVLYITYYILYSFIIYYICNTCIYIYTVYILADSEKKNTRGSAIKTRPKTWDVGSSNERNFGWVVPTFVGAGGYRGAHLPRLALLFECPWCTASLCPDDGDWTGRVSEVVAFVDFL